MFCDESAASTGEEGQQKIVEEENKRFSDWTCWCKLGTEYLHKTTTGFCFMTVAQFFCKIVGMAYIFALLLIYFEFILFNFI